MHERVKQYFAEKYNTTDFSVVIRFSHDCNKPRFEEYTISRAVKEFEENIDWFFWHLPETMRSEERAFEVTRKFYEKHLLPVAIKNRNNRR